MSKYDEIIVVAETEKIFAGATHTESLHFVGTEIHQGKVSQILGNIALNYTSMRRGDAEENTDYKQPIPYLVVRKGNKVFAYKRLEGGGEEKLHGKISIGVGGHMNPLEIKGGETKPQFSHLLIHNYMRELTEELEITTPAPPEVNLKGIINDETEVGQVHIGILIELYFPEEAEIKVRETDTLEGVWMDVIELQQGKIFDRLESWSQYAAEVLDELTEEELKGEN